MQPFVLLVALAWAQGDIPPPAGGPQVTLGPPAAVVDTGTSPPQLKLSAQARNALAWPVDSLTVGVLYASDRAALAAAGVDLFAAPEAAPPGVGVLVQRVPVTLEPQAILGATLSAALPAGEPPPTLFQLHVLGYTLADVDAATLFDLIATDAAADEWAACAVFGLEADAAARRVARQRWAHHRSFKGDLAAALLLPVDAKPNQADTFRRVFAARALGVLGGPSAEDTLVSWRDSPELDRYDSPLQVLRLGRVTGSPFATPLAYAIPEAAVHMREVIDAALSDAQHLGPTNLPAGGMDAPPVVDPDPIWWSQPSAWAFLLGGLVFGLASMHWLKRVP